jgi:hypothetical protein
MPLTAIALMMEFTRVDHDFLIPMVFAVVGVHFRVPLHTDALNFAGHDRTEPGSVVCGGAVAIAVDGKRFLLPRIITKAVIARTSR